PARRTRTMRTRRPYPGLLASGAAVGLLLCLAAAAPAQAPHPDPVDAFLDALERDLDNLPSPADTARKPIRDAILEHRAKVLDELTKKLTTPAELSRALRVRDPERFRRANRNDAGLWETVDGRVFNDLLNRLY